MSGPGRESVVGLVRLAAGWTMIVLGLAGLFLPILQGLLFLAVGVVLLAPEIPLFRRISIWMQRRFPHLRKPLKRFRRTHRRSRRD